MPSFSLVAICFSLSHFEVEKIDLGCTPAADHLQPWLSHAVREAQDLRPKTYHSLLSILSSLETIVPPKQLPKIKHKKHCSAEQPLISSTKTGFVSEENSGTKTIHRAPAQPGYPFLRTKENSAQPDSIPLKTWNLELANLEQFSPLRFKTNRKIEHKNHAKKKKKNSNTNIASNAPKETCQHSSHPSAFIRSSSA